jgi:hypothetical protein
MGFFFEMERGLVNEITEIRHWRAEPNPRGSPKIGENPL